MASFSLERVNTPYGFAQEKLYLGGGSMVKNGVGTPSPAPPPYLLF